MKRQVPLITDSVYHIYNRSIAHYEIFNNIAEYDRMRHTFQYYQYDNTSIPTSMNVSIDMGISVSIGIYIGSSDNVRY